MGGNIAPRGQNISGIKSCKFISNRCLYNIVRVKDLESETHPFEFVPVTKAFSEVFPNNLSEIPPEWEIDFGINYCKIHNLF